MTAPSYVVLLRSGRCDALRAIDFWTGVCCAKKAFVKPHAQSIPTTALQSKAMATARPCLAQLSRPCLLSTRTPVTFASARSLSTSTPLQKKGEKIQSKKPLKLVKMVDRQKNKKLEQAAAKAGKKKPKNTYGDEVNIGQLDRFALVDAVRYFSPSQHNPSSC